MAQHEKQRADIYEQVTNQIIQCIEAGAGDWQMPWHKSGSGLNRPINIDTGNSYRGINVVSLWASAQMRDFNTGTWGTYRQWQKQGCQVRKGEKSSLVIFYKEFTVEDDTAETDEPTCEIRRVARASYVFNADQVDGYDIPTPPEQSEPVHRCQAAEEFIMATGADIRHGGQRAFYQTGDDFIQMPDETRFQGSDTSSVTESYYATLLHELTHWSGHERRCDREFGKRFGDNAYAMEELVAELGAAFLCADLKITNAPRPDHAAYIDNWLTVLKADKKAIFTAASQAAKATDFLTSPQTRDKEAA
jgi:antirestriction protein ArdC